MSDFLREQLKRAGRTQQEFADAIHRDRVVATRIINGTQALKLEQLEPAARILGLSVADLLTGLGIPLGLPQTDTGLLSDCLLVVLHRAPDMPPETQAKMAATLYAEALQRPDITGTDTGMDAAADMLAKFARARG